VELASGQVTGAEALLRWRHPDYGMVSPAEFIPLAEETGLILPLGEWVLQAACKQASAWVKQGLTAVSMAVNLSARQFHSQNLANLCQRALGEAGLEPGYLELELTESAVMQNVEEAIETLQELKAIGLRLAMDDFGTGYSSLSYLKRFPIDSLKIDQSFVRNITTDPDDAAIAVTVIAMAHTLKLRVVAEGVETKQQLDFLRAHGCHEAQGYYLSRPLPAAEVTSLLRKNCPLPLP
jgi:EAL domain-containing protein (putative c-di-GMP-specific phosphodiesterase class I)